MKKNVINKYDKLLFLLIVTIPVSGFGTFSAPKVLAILFLPTLFNKIRGCISCYKSTILCISLFMAYCFFSFIWTPDVEEGIRSLIYFILNFTLFFEIIVFARYARNPIPVIMVSWIVAFAATTPIAIWEILTDNHLAVSKVDDEAMMENFGGVVMQRYAATVTFYNVNGYSTYMCFCLPFILCAVNSFEISIIKKIPLIVTALLCVVLMLINSSRGALMVVLISLTIMFFYTAKSARKVLSLVVFALVLFFFIMRNSDMILGVITARSADGGLTNNTAREIIWGNAFKVLADYNYFGCGIGGMMEAMRKYAKGGVIVTHNLFFEVLIQYGVAVCLFFLYWISKSFVSIFKIHDKQRRMCLFLIFAGMPFSTLINSGYLLEPMIYVLFASVYVFLYYERIKSFYNPVWKVARK